VDCAVLPFYNNVAAIPEEATANEIILCARNFASKRFSMKILPVPPGASRKNNSPISCNMLWKIVL
jgi:hypothetical protein